MIERQPSDREIRGINSASSSTPRIYPRYVPIGGGVEKDLDINAALLWLATCSGDPPVFWDRLLKAQQAYRQFTANMESRGQDPSWSDIGADQVASFLAQGKSLLDDRRSYDFVLVAHVAPWLKQLGNNRRFLERIKGAEGRVQGMLRNARALPDAAMFELVMASNYAAAGFDVEFIDEDRTQRTPDLRLSRRGAKGELFVELKRLRRGEYELAERRRHTSIFQRLEAMIDERRLSIDVDVTYTKELTDVPEDYLLQRVRHSLASPIVLPGGYPWRDDFGHGLVRAADVAAVRRDTRDSYLYFGTKMARLLAGRVVSENNYHLAASASPNVEDSRYADRFQYGSVVTWHSTAQAAIDRKGRFVRSKLSEADLQIDGHGKGIIHIAMDAELHSAASDLRRQRNLDSLSTFRMKSQAFAVYLHYLVPRVSEGHSWLCDETVDTFSRLDSPPPPFPAFPDAPELANDEPAWRQNL